LLARAATTSPELRTPRTTEYVTNLKVLATEGDIAVTARPVNSAGMMPIEYPANKKNGITRLTGLGDLHKRNISLNEDSDAVKKFDTVRNNTSPNSGPRNPNVATVHTERKMLDRIRAPFLIGRGAYYRGLLNRNSQPDRQQM
jgi:hypothetical protein